jgi:outer membrane protein assembly factor BamB
MDRKSTLPAYLILPMLFVVTLVSIASGDDWPSYRHDAQRTGISSDKLRTPLTYQWAFSALHAPSHAWGDPQPKVVEGNLEMPRMRFDDTFHPVIAGGLIYFASSADNKIYCLSAFPIARIYWEFCTDGPVRLAPTVAGGKVYAGSDDGNVYCLDAKTGKLLWTFRAAESNQMVIGNGKMISISPVRTGVIVDKGVAYFGAGVFPAEGVNLYAVNAENGKLIWKNNGFGKGGLGDISPQGYMVASKDRLFVASGRAMPATFNRSDGRLVRHTKFVWRRTGLFGGTYSFLAGDMLYNGTERMLGVTAETGKLQMSEEAQRMIVTKDTAYILSGTEVVALDRADWTKKQGSKKLYAAQQKVKKLKQRIAYEKWIKRPGVPTKGQQASMKKYVKQRDAEQKVWNESVKWRAKCTHTGAMALSKNVLIVGGKNEALGFDIASGKKVWSAKVDGNAKGLAIANGNVLVSTDKGRMLFFTSAQNSIGGNTVQKADPKVYPPGASAHPSETLAQQIIKDSGVDKGFGLVLGGTGRLAYELSKRSKLMIYVVNPDAKAAAKARRQLSAAGVLGARVTVINARLDALGFSDYFANLIVSTDASTPAAELLRMLKPCGGAARVIQSDKSKLNAWSAAMKKALASTGDTVSSVSIADSQVKVTRGALSGAGSWAHEYGNADNSGCGDDTLVKGQLNLLWYGEPGPGQMPSRHASAAAPLAFDGKMFVQGENVIMAYDAYNGVELWKRNISGALRLGLKTKTSNLTGGMGSLFVVVGTKCLRLDATSGKTLAEYGIPGAADDKAKSWQYVACVGKALYGSDNTGRIFAIDVKTGKVKWTHKTSQLMTVTISIGDGRLFYVDRSVTDAQKAEGLKGRTDKDKVYKDARGRPIPPVRLVVCLNAESGKTKWAKPLFIADCIPPVTKAHGDITMMYSKGVVLLAGQPWNGHFWREFFAGKFSRRSLIALSGDDGKMLWSGNKGYRSRPLIVGDRVIAEPWAHDLRTGQEYMRSHPITEATARWQFARPGHHCGNIAAAPNMLLFRSGTAGYYDLGSDTGTVHFGGQRPGCWINCIPANGLVMMPEASSGCVCPNPIQCTTVFIPRPAGGKWTMYSAPGDMTPVKRLAINFGAPGDRKDSRGNIWLAHPRPYKGRLVMDPKVDAKLLKNGRYYTRNSDFLKTSGPVATWVYASGASGVTKLSIPLQGKNSKTQRYTLRLHFIEPSGAKPGKRIFDISLQGKSALKKFDIASAGGAVVKEFRRVSVDRTLSIEFKPSDLTEDGTSKHPPVISGLEIIAE